jgi:hypothetical protein
MTKIEDVDGAFTRAELGESVRHSVARRPRGGARGLREGPGPVAY